MKCSLFFLPIALASAFAPLEIRDSGCTAVTLTQTSTILKTYTTVSTRCLGVVKPTPIGGCSIKTALKVSTYKSKVVGGTALFKTTITSTTKVCPFPTKEPATQVGGCITKKTTFESTWYKTVFGNGGSGFPALMHSTVTKLTTLCPFPTPTEGEETATETSDEHSITEAPEPPEETAKNCPPSVIAQVALSCVEKSQVPCPSSKKCSKYVTVTSKGACECIGAKKQVTNTVLGPTMCPAYCGCTTSTVWAMPAGCKTQKAYYNSR